jgi:hypothetical protein
MADYTRSVSASDREGLRNLLVMHQRHVEPVLTGRGGRVVKNIGDSFMALFESATDAVRAALDLVEAHAPGQGSNVAFRAGVCTGDVEETENDAFGEPVNMAARIIAKTPTGEVWFATSTLHCMNQAEIPWESTGRHALKGIPGDVEVFRAVPMHAAYLPDVLVAAVRARSLVRWQQGDPVPVLLPSSQLLLEGFRPGSQQLAEAVDRLPLVDPSRLWLSTFNISPNDRFEWTRAGRGLIVGTPGAVRAAVQQHERAPSRAAGSDTIILDGGATAVLDLVIAGLALPSPPAGQLAEVIAGYTYDLLPDGRWVNRSDRALLRVEVGTAGVTVTVLSPGVQVSNQVSPVNATLPLQDGTTVRCAAGSMRYVALNQEGYVGALVGDTQMRLGVGAGQQVELGREPNHPGLLLPDRNNQDNIRWLGGPRAARAREKGYTLDKVLTGRRQTGVMVDSGKTTILPLHETCPTYLLDTNGTVTRVTSPRAAVTGELLLLGTTVVALRQPEV